MFACPLGVREFIFEHGLIRPPEYAEHYETADALASRYTRLYTPHRRAPNRRKRPRASTLRVIPEDEWNDSTRDAIEASSVPFDVIQDVVVQYGGSRGTSFQFVIEHADYREHLENKDVGICTSKQGYVHLKNPKRALHRIVLGLRTGDRNTHGCHGSGGKLDNRKRVMRADTASGNLRDILKKRSTTSQQRGLVFRRGRWSAQLKVNKRTIRTSPAESYDEAVAIAREAYSRVNEMVKLDHAAAKSLLREIAEKVRKSAK